MNKRLVSVDALRALAALAVLINHIPLNAYFIPEPIHFWLFLPKHYGWVGVPLFVVLSGYCIHIAVVKNSTSSAQPQISWIKFWKRRFWRLYPPYAIVATLSVCLYFMMGADSYPAENRIPHLLMDVLSHVFMVHNLFRDYCIGLGNGPLWSLGMEEQLYALYFVFLLIRTRKGLKFTLILTLIIALTWSLGLRYLLGIKTWSVLPSWGEDPFALGHWMQWPFAWWFVWTLGALAAELSMHQQTLPKWSYSIPLIVIFTIVGICLGDEFLVTIAGVPGPVAYSGLSEFSFGLASFGILNQCIRRETAGKFKGWFARKLAALGQMSYSLYLVHWPCIYAIRYLLGPNDGPIDEMISSTACGLGSLLLAFVMFHVVEKHFLFSKSKVSETSKQL